MTLRSLIHYRAHARCRDRSDYSREEVELGSDFAHNYFDRHPDASEEECSEAAREAGILVTLAILSLIIQVAYIAWKEWRDRRRGEEE